VAVSAVFAIHGAVVGSFATRIPWIAGRLHVDPGALGLALIAPALGSIATMPVAARLVHRYRGRPLTRILIVAWCGSVALPALAPNLPVLFLTLLVYGAAAGMSDVAMNAQGVVVEQRYGRSIMSGLHGMWSVGGLVGSAAGALAAHRNVDARLHLVIVAVVLAVLGWLAGWALLDTRGESGGASERPPLFAWPSRAVLLIGLVGFCAVFAEGASGDWSAVYLTNVTRADPGLAALAYTGFALAMTAGRLTGRWRTRTREPRARSRRRRLRARRHRGGGGGTAGVRRGRSRRGKPRPRDRGGGHHRLRFRTRRAGHHRRDRPPVLVARRLRGGDRAVPGDGGRRDGPAATPPRAGGHPTGGADRQRRHRDRRHAAGHYGIALWDAARVGCWAASVHR
jgi:MFS family permease